MTVVNFKTDKRISDEERTILRDFCRELGGDLLDLATRLGLSVVPRRLRSSQSGFIEYDPQCGSKSGYRIVINDSHPIGRQKFTLAHEIGHFVLHKDTRHFSEKRDQSADIFVFPSGNRAPAEQFLEEYPRWMETEADNFAATNLLPAHLLKGTLEYQSGEPASLAKRLGYSVGFVTRRFEEIHFN